MVGYVAWRLNTKYQEAKDKYGSTHLLTFTAIGWTQLNHSQIYEGKQKITKGVILIMNIQTNS